MAGPQHNVSHASATDANPTANELEIDRKQMHVGTQACVVRVSEWVGKRHGPSSPLPPPPPLHMPPAPQSSQAAMSPMQSVSTLCNSAIGVGVLALPFAFHSAGLVGGFLLCLAIGLAEGFTLYVLSKFAERYDCGTYGALVRRTLGRKLMVVTSVMMAIYLFGSCVIYLIIVGDTFSSLGRLYLGPDNLFASKQHVTFMLGMGVLLPLCLLRRLGHLAALNMVAVTGFLYTAAVVCGQGLSQALSREGGWQDGVQLVRWSPSLLNAIPIIVFGFNCHSNVVTIYVELDEDSKPLLRALPSLTLRAKPQKLVSMLGVIATALAFIMTSYVLVGAAGYVGWPTSLSSNVLDALPMDPWVQAAQVVIGFVVLTHYPLTHHPARSAFKDVLVLCYAHPPYLLTNLFTLAFVGGSTALAMVVTSLGSVLNVIAGTTASFLIFMLPGLMLINAAIKKRSRSTLNLLIQDPDNAEVEGLDEPLLREVAEKGIRKTGIIYQPGKSWAAGIFLVVLSVLLFALTCTLLIKPAPP